MISIRILHLQFKFQNSNKSIENFEFLKTIVVDGAILQYCFLPAGINK